MFPKMVNPKDIAKECRRRGRRTVLLINCLTVFIINIVFHRVNIDRIYVYGAS